MSEQSTPYAAPAPDTGADPLDRMRLTNAEVQTVVRQSVSVWGDRYLAVADAQLQKAVRAMVPWLRLAVQGHEHGSGHYCTHRDILDFLAALDAKEAPDADA